MEKKDEVPDWDRVTPEKRREKVKEVHGFTGGNNRVKD